MNYIFVDEIPKMQKVNKFRTIKQLVDCMNNLIEEQFLSGDERWYIDEYGDLIIPNKITNVKYVIDINKR